MGWFEDRLKAAVGTPEFEAETALLEITEQVNDRIDQLGMSRAEVARAMGKNRAVVTRVLSGDHNMTFRTLVTMLCAVGLRMKPVFEEIAAEQEVTMLDGATVARRPADDEDRYEVTVNVGSEVGKVLKSTAPVGTGTVLPFRRPETSRTIYTATSGDGGSGAAASS